MVGKLNRISGIVMLGRRNPLELGSPVESPVMGSADRGV